MRIKYDEIPLDKVLKYFVEGYDFADEEVYDYDYWIDNGEIVIKLYIQDED